MLKKNPLHFLTKAGLLFILVAGSSSVFINREPSCGQVSGPVEQPEALQTCSYTRDGRAAELGVSDTKNWGYATCWITAVADTGISRDGAGGTLDILDIEVWGTRNGEAVRLRSFDESPITWCERRGRNGDWDEAFWKGFEKWDDESCAGRRSFSLLASEILHIGTAAFDSRGIQDVQCIVTGKTSKNVRYDVGVDFRKTDTSPAWPAIEGGFSGWNRCTDGNGIRTASPRGIAEAPDCRPPESD